MIHGATRSLCLHAMGWNEQLRAQHHNNNDSRYTRAPQCSARAPSKSLLVLRDVSVAHSDYTGFCIYQSRMQGGLSLQTRRTQCVRPCAFDRRVQQNCIRLHKRPVRAFSAKANGKAEIFTLLLDCDGVLVDTEAQGHRVSFNEAFKQKGQAVHYLRARTCRCAYTNIGYRAGL